MENDELRTVACVLRSGGRYTADWVARLQRGVARNMGAHRFVCLSDVPVPCERIPLTTNWPGWWSKIELFRPGLLTGPTLYLDLDTIITGPLDRLFRDDFAMVPDFVMPGQKNSGVMAWSGDRSRIWREMRCNPDATMAHYDAWPGGRIGDQAFIEDVMGSEAGTFEPGLVASFKRDCQSGIPAGASAISFHGRRKPPDLLNIEWVRDLWK